MDRASARTLLLHLVPHTPPRHARRGMRLVQKNGTADMATSPWYLEIVRVSSPEKQQELLRLLHHVTGVTALGSSAGIDHFVILECPDLRLKTAIEKLFLDVDPAAVLTHTARQPLQPEGGGIA